MDGFSCWDLNQNGMCDLMSEDVNGDGNCTTADCAGAPCWDLNGNLVCDLMTEDIDMDGNCTVLDCQGPPGVNGTDGMQGPPGPVVPIGDLTDVEITNATTSHFLHFENGTWVNRPITGLIPTVTVSPPPAMAPIVPLTTVTISATCPVGLSLTGGSCEQSPVIFPDLVLNLAGSPTGLPTTWACAWSFLGLGPPPVGNLLTVTAICV